MKPLTAIVHFLIALPLCHASANAAPQKQPAHPNIVVFLADDMGLMDTSAPFLTGPDGESETHPLNRAFNTQALDCLASQGTRFETFYANSVCSPTRASLLTGQSSARHHVTQWISPYSNNAGDQGPADWRWEGITSKERTLPVVLREAGYRTIHCGKGHLAPRDREGERLDNIGFDVSIGGNSAGHPGSYYGKVGFRGVPDLQKYHGQDIYLDEALTLEMKDAIGTAVQEGKPFFAYMAYYVPHAPFQANAKYLELYEDAFESEQAKAYATMIHTMDASIGDLLNHLESLGVAENTLVIFLSDNGGVCPVGDDPHAIGSSAPLRGKKATHYEGGMRVPFIAAWAKPNPSNPFQQRVPIAAGHHSREMADVTDIAPTLLAAADIKSDLTFDGSNIAPALAGKSLDRKPVWLMHFPHAHNSSYFTVYREGGWKLIYHYTKQPDMRYELFHLKEDRAEQKNLAGQRPDKLKSMMASMIEALDAAGAQFPRESKESDRPLRPVMPPLELSLSNGLQ